MPEKSLDKLLINKGNIVPGTANKGFIDSAINYNLFGSLVNVLEPQRKTRLKVQPFQY